MTVVMLDSEKTMQVFERFGVLEENVKPVFPGGSDRVFRALRGDGAVDLSSLSDEELYEWVNSVEAFCNFIGESGCFYGEALFSDGLNAEERADTMVTRFHGRHPVRRMF